MEVVERSSSNDLSSAPNSDAETPNSAYNTSNTITVSRDGPSSHSHQTPNTAGVKAQPSQAQAHALGTPTSTPGARQDTATAKQRKPRKKKESDVALTPVEKKEKGTRKPRAGASAASGPGRKKLKVEPAILTPSTLTPAPAVETITLRPTQQTVIDLTAQPNLTSNEAAKVSQNGFSNKSSTMSPPKQSLSQYNPTPPSQPHVARSMAYDPVRGMSVPRNTEPPSHSILPQSNLRTPPRMVFNPSTSPAISSIINPPDPVDTKDKSIITPSQSQAAAVQPSHIFTTSVEESTKMEVDPPATVPEPPKKPTPEAALSKPVTKPRAKEQPPPLPAGSGLLSSSLFGGDTGIDTEKNSNDRGTSIVLHVDLKNPDNNVINFARLAEQKYGFAALYPRQAAQKERLAKVAAAGAALERAAAGIKGTPGGESGDEDVSVDIDRDSDNDGDVAMSGMNGTGEAVNSGTDGPAPKRRKRKDEYDADDPFVDDTEMLWESSAATSKEGFFVYCGPLVAEGEKPVVERADGTIKRGRGRGRGGGPGSRGGRGGAAATRDGEGGSTRGGGPGSRGGGITRKPRITKAERALREAEKKQREQMAVLAAKPPNYQP